MTGTPATEPPGTTEALTTANAPLVTACPAKDNPSDLVPGTAKKTSPGRTDRLSTDRPDTTMHAAG
jgi:hypothetical protein